MPRAMRLTESENYKRLEREYPRLKKDKAHRRAFHDYLSNHYIRGVDKPITYQELKKAYLDFLP